MTKNPFYNALSAIVYIAIIVTLVFFAPTIIKIEKESVFIPIGMLSLFVLSAAVMACLFFYRPVIMLLDGERDKALKLLLQTIGIFACIVVAGSVRHGG
jgi:hypothetical protein